MKNAAYLLILAALVIGCRHRGDVDDDGFDTVAGDCDDENAAVFPGAGETCNDVDDDCNGVVDDAASDGKVFYVDADGDGVGSTSTTQMACAAPAGFAAEDGDCDDVNVSIHPGASETDCTDEVDYNCDGSSGYADADNDGFAACKDCDDSSAAFSPVATEICDGKDNNCDGDVDVAAVDAGAWYADVDQDGFGDADAVQVACDAPSGTVADDSDCDDTDADIRPDAIETCNVVDDDCDGDIDDNASDQTTWYADVDGDGAFGSRVTTLSCAQPAGYGAAATDCDDLDADTYLEALEQCDGADNDCDGVVDEAGAIGERTWYADADADGFGGTATTKACDQPQGYVAGGGDCNDAAIGVHPGATERCNGADDDCDGLADNGAADASLWHADTDTDGHGSITTTARACAAPLGYVLNGDDCNDSVATIYLGAAEICNTVDDNCDGAIDNNPTDAKTWFVDADRDGRGWPATSKRACDVPVGYVYNADDCNDRVATTYLGAAELCNGVDDDCNGVVDNGLPLKTFYADLDADTYGDATNRAQTCAAAPGYVTDKTDCDDADNAISPAGLEVCDDGIDNDCDTFADCLDNADCRDVEAICWLCPDGYRSPDEECDDGNHDNGDSCSNTCTLNMDLSNLYNSYSSASRMVYVFKSNPLLPLATYNTFCEDRGLQWFVPKSQADAQLAITTCFNYDAYHTWILTKNNVTSTTWGGYSVITDGGFSQVSSVGFSAVRKWGSSSCDPEQYNTTKCWDSDHQYDWLLCQGG